MGRVNALDLIRRIRRDIRRLAVELARKRGQDPPMLTESVPAGFPQISVDAGAVLRVSPERLKKLGLQGVAMSLSAGRSNLFAQNGVDMTGPDEYRQDQDTVQDVADNPDISPAGQENHGNGGEKTAY